MKLDEAMKIIENHEKGFMVSFERKEGGILHSDHFPYKHDGEELIKTEEEAWILANRFANAIDKNVYFNIYVTDHNFRPVANYNEKIINRR